MLITLQSHLEVQAYITAHRADLDPSTSPETTPDTRTGIISISPQTLASLCASYTTTHPRAFAFSPRRLLRRIRHFLSLPDNGAWAATWDTTFARHLSLLEHVKEYKERRAVGKGKQTASGVTDSTNGKTDAMTSLQGSGLPMLASACPGWVCYAEKAHGELLGFVSAVRSSQGVMGALVKQWWAARKGKSYVLSLSFMTVC
jgi:iron only hydrogenase large subunit-like protein